MRFLKSDPISPAGLLIPRRRAPRCVRCGRVLWTPIYPGGLWPQRNSRNERLSFVPEFHGTLRGPRCWNGKACTKRKASVTTEGTAAQG